MVANALDMPQDDYSLHERLKWAIQILRRGELVEDSWTQLRWKEIKKPRSEATDAEEATLWNRTLTPRQRLIGASFRVFVTSSEDGLLERIQRALSEPARPLYLGESDDFVSIESLELQDSRPTMSDVISTVVQGVHPGTEIVNLPIRIVLTDSGPVIRRQLVSVAQQVHLGSSVGAQELDDGTVVVMLDESGACKA